MQLDPNLNSHSESFPPTPNCSIYYMMNKYYVIGTSRNKSLKLNSIFFPLPQKKFKMNLRILRGKNNHSKPGIYEINCDKCRAQYIGRTKSNIKHFKEHFHI